MLHSPAVSYSTLVRSLSCFVLPLMVKVLVVDSFEHSGLLHLELTGLSVLQAVSPALKHREFWTCRSSIELPRCGRTPAKTIVTCCALR